MVRLFFVLTMISCFVHPCFAQDTLIGKNGNRMVVHVISVDSVVRYRVAGGSDKKEYSIKVSELGSIGHGNSRKDSTSKTALEKSVKGKPQPIHPFGLMYSMNHTVLSEPQMLDTVSRYTTNNNILSNISRTRTTRKVQFGMMIGGGAMLIAGVGLVELSPHPRIAFSSGEAAGILLIVGSFPIEALAVFPYIVRKVFATTVVNKYNAEILN